MVIAEGVSNIDEDTDEDHVDSEIGETDADDIPVELDDNGENTSIPHSNQPSLSVDIDSDNEFDTPEAREQLASLMITGETDLSQKSNDCTKLADSLGIYPAYVQPGKDCNDPLPTQLFDDIFHVQNHLFRHLPKAHSAFKPFARELSHLMMIEDVDDHRQVEAVLLKKQKSWQYMMRANPDAIHKRVRCFCPPPEILVPHLKALFEDWKNVKCSIDPSRGPLFSAAAQKQADAIIRVAQLGLISDPPGYPLYYKMGVDRDGLSYYCCIHGTNSVLKVEFI